MENNRILDIITSRKSVREFRDQTIKDEIITNILEAGRWAPSGLNNQPWCFIVVRDRTAINSMAECTRYSSIIRGAPLLIAVLLDTNVMYDHTKDTQACGAAIENMLLAVHGQGLGAVWLGQILKNKTEVNRILQLSDNFDLMAVVALGHPANRNQKSRRKDFAELLLKEM